MKNYNYGFNTPRLLTNPAYYHKIISCGTFIYLDLIPAQKSRSFNVFRLLGSTVTLQYAKAKRHPTLKEIHLVKGWNQSGTTFINTLLYYRNSTACKYKERIDALINMIMALPESFSYADVVKAVDSHIITTMFNVARKSLSEAPSLVSMKEKTEHEKSIDRISALITQNLAGYYPTNVRVGLRTFEAGIEIEDRPNWIKSIECQKMTHDHKITNSIVNLLGEFDDPLAALLEAYTFVEVSEPLNECN